MLLRESALFRPSRACSDVDSIENIRHRLIALALLCAALPLDAQSSRWSIEGVILNAVTGEPVAAATAAAIPAATADDAAGITATSDEHGRFTIGGLAPGRYILAIRKAGFVASYGPDGTLTANSTFVLGDEDRPKQFVVRLVPNAIVTGRIEDEDGRSVDGAIAIAYRVAYSPAGKRLVQIGRDLDPVEGRYRISELPSGRYYIAVAQRDESLRPSYYPGTPHLETAVPIDLAAGTILGNINVKLVNPETVCAQIEVDRPRDGLEVGFWERRTFAPSWFHRAAPLSDAGHYEACGLLPGPYFATASDRSGYVMRHSVEIAAMGERLFRLLLLPQVDVTGRIVFEGDPPTKVAPIRIELRSFERAASNAPRVEVTDSWTFTLKSINPDLYRVVVADLPRGYYVKAVGYGDTDALANGLPLAGASTRPLEIVVSPNVGGLTGAVERRNGDPAALAIVVLLPEEPDRQGSEMFFGAGVADDSGAFNIGNVAPGRYRVVAFEAAPESGAILDPEYRSRVADRGESIDVREKSVARVRLKVIPASEMR